MKQTWDIVSNIWYKSKRDRERERVRQREREGETIIPHRDDTVLAWQARTQKGPGGSKGNKGPR